MTTYLASRLWTQTGYSSMGVLAGTYPVRIAKIDFWGAYFTGTSAGTKMVYAYVSNYAGAGFSGGTTITPLPMRGGSPPSTATVKWGYTSISGTGSYMTVISAGNAGADGSPSTSSYSFPFDYILPPGSAIDVNGLGQLGTGNTWGVFIYYEELRLAWSN